MDRPGRKNPLTWPGMPKSLIRMPVRPEILYWFSKLVYRRYGLPILFTENGFSNIDFVMRDGKVHDPQRIDYIATYLTGLKRALDEGLPVVGYLYWSLTDNFEWMEGYDMRFGLIHVDYRTQKRTLKDSAYYYHNVIATNGQEL
jgi:beta-glucosidase